MGGVGLIKVSPPCDTVVDIVPIVVVELIVPLVGTGVGALLLALLPFPGPGAGGNALTVIGASISS